LRSDTLTREVLSDDAFEEKLKERGFPDIIVRLILG
jgi:hypothetical protein